MSFKKFLLTSISTLLFVSQHSMASSSPNEGETTSAAAWRMPEILQLTPEKHALVEHLLRQASTQNIEELFTLVQHHILSAYSVGSFRNGDHIVRDVSEFAEILAGKSVVTSRLFFHCVALANRRLPLYNETADYKSSPMHVSDLGLLMDAIAKFPEDEQSTAVELAERLFAITGNRYNNCCITEILRPLFVIPFEKRASVVDATQRLAPLQFLEPGKILKLFKPVTLEELPSLTDFILQLDHEYEGCIQLRYGIEDLKSIVGLPPARRQSLIENVRPFMAFPDMLQDSKRLFSERQRIVHAIASLPEESLPMLLDQVTELRRRAHEISPTEKFTDIADYGDLIEALGRIPMAERISLMNEVLRVIQGPIWGGCYKSGLGGWRAFNNQIAGLLFTIHECMQHNPHHYFEYLQDMLSMTNNQILEARIPLLQTLDFLFERHDDVAVGPIVRRISRLLPYLLSDDAAFYESERAIVMARKIHFHLADFDQIIPLLELPLSQEQRNIMIEALLEMTTPQHRIEGSFVHVRPIDRDDFFAEALRLCRLPIANPDYKFLINRLAAASQGDRHGLVQQLVDLNKPSYTQGEIVGILGTWNRLERIWLDREGRPLPGLDVHAGDRDQKVTEALRILVTTQGHVSTEDLMADVAACKDYITRGSFSDEQKLRALNAIDGKRVANGWGSLLSQSSSDAFANLDGIGLVGRLWRFADRYVDPEVPNDAENARRAFVMACVDSADTDSWMVCNLGKVQRIVCSVLQGRLPEIAVDREARVTRVDEGGPAEAPAEEPALDLTGQRLAALYLQTLQNEPHPPQTEAAMCEAAAAWLLAQGNEVDDATQHTFFEDVKAFFAMMG